MINLISKKSVILFPILLLFFFNSFGQTKIKIPKEFKETIPPKPETEAWYELNGSRNEFGVTNIDGKLDIKKVKETNECTLKISTGTLIGVDGGEFGGNLSFVPADSTQKTIQILKGNIKYLFEFKGKIYFITGIAHMGYSAGAISKLDTTKDNFTSKIIVEFDDAPEAFTIYKDKLLIATHENFYIVKNFKKELIFKKTFWESLYPNSIVAFDDKNVFIGMRSGIVKVDLTNKTIKFYKNDK
jgi:hypothetical protein